MIEYLDDGKRAIFDGLVFVRDAQTGYYRNSRVGRLHRYVYEYVNGQIPDGYHVHHVDFDKSNNEPENLIALTERDHLKLHGDCMTDDRKNQLRETLICRAVPASKQWHRSDTGREWHRAHYEEMKNALHRRKQMNCAQCGKPFDGLDNSVTRFCSNACKSAHRRAIGIDNVTRTCAWCGNAFSINKYSAGKTCCRSCANRLRHSLSKNQNDAPEAARARV